MLSDSFNRLKFFRPQLEVNFNPAAWEKDFLGELTGSWAYALNLPQIAEAKPGYLASNTLHDERNLYGSIAPRDRDDLKARLARDEIEYLGDLLPESGHVVAFFVREMDQPTERGERTLDESLIPRRDSNGRWSVKTSGGCESPFFPQQTDFSGKPIYDVLKADFCNFTQFLGYAMIPYGGIPYYSRIKINDEAMKPFFRAVPAQVKLGLAKG